MSATALKSRGTATNTTGSLAVTPNRKLATIRVRPNADASPIATPTSATPMPWRTIMFRTSSESAPKASWMPISRVRCSTEYAINP